MPSETYEIDIQVIRPNQISGSILTQDIREETVISNIPNEKAIILKYAVKYGLPMDTFEQLREEMFEIWRVVLDLNGITPELIGKLINQVKKSSL